MELKFRTAPATLDSATEGRLRAAFSVFDEIDSDGDVVRASAFTPGQAVPLVWSHDWARPIGKGTVAIEGNAAVFDGGFFLNTRDGRDAYETVKAMSELQEFSWGFHILDAAPITVNGAQVREILKAELFEVSPVLVGANRNTRTLALKGGEPIEAHSGRVLAEVVDYVARERSLADLRAKEGRALSATRRTRLTGMQASLREHADELEALLIETAPPEKAARAAAVMAEFLALDARRLGVQV